MQGRIDFTSDAGQVDAAISRLRAQVAALKTEIADLNRVSQQYAGTNVNTQIERSLDRQRTIERELAQLTGERYKNIKAGSGELEILQRTIDQSANRMRVLHASTRDVVNAMTGVGAATANHVARQRELNIAFSATERSLRNVKSELKDAGNEADGFWRKFMRGGRTPVSLFDEGMRGQRGAMMSTLGASFGAAGVGGGGLMVGAIGAVAAVGVSAAIMHSAEAMGRWAEQTKAGAQASGMALGPFSQLQGALQLIGLKGDLANTTLRQFARNLSTAMADPVSRQAQAFHVMGISQDELAKSGGDVLKIFLRYADAWTSTADSANKARSGEELFGRALEHVAPLLDKSGTGVQALMSRARQLGITLTEETASKLIDTGNKAEELANKIRGQGIQAFIAWKPEIDAVIGALAQLSALVGSIVTGLGDLAKAADRASGGWAGAAAKFAIEPWPGKLFRAMQGSGAEPAASAMIPPQRGEAVNEVRDWLKSHDYSPGAAAAVMGNIQTESSFNPYAVNASGHKGLIQWDKERWGKLTAEAGTQQPDISQQLAYLDKEVQARMPGFKTSNESAGALAQQFESKIEQSGGQLLGQRVSAATGFAGGQQEAGPMDLDVLTRNFNREMEFFHAQTTEREKQFDLEIAQKHGDLTATAAIEKQKQTFAEEQIKKEKAIWEKYVESYAQRMGTTSKDVMALPSEQQPDWYKELGTKILQAQTQFTQIQVQGVQLQSRIETERFQMAEKNATAERRVNSERLRGFVDEEQAAVRLRELSPFKAIAAEAALAKSLADQNLATLQSVLQKAHGEIEVNTVNAQIQEETARARREQLDFEKRKAEEIKIVTDKWIAPIKSAFDSFGSSVESAMTGLLTRQKTWAQAMADVQRSALETVFKSVGSILSRVAGGLLGGKSGEGLGDVIGNKITNWVGDAIGKEVLGLGTKTATDAAAGAAFAGEVSASGIAFAGTVEAAGIAFAASASAGGAASGGGGLLGGILSIGTKIGAIALAPETGGLSLVGAAAPKGGWDVPSFAGGGWDIPGGLAQLHPREMVLPENLAQGVRDMVSNGGAGGDNHLHLHAPIMDGPSLDRWFNGVVSRNPQAMRKLFSSNALTPRALFAGR